MKQFTQFAKGPLAALLTLAGGCQLITGVNDLRVDDDVDETTGDTDDSNADAAGDDDSDDSDNTRSDAPEDAGDDTDGSDDSDNSDETSSVATSSGQGSTSVAAEAGVEPGTSDPTDGGVNCEIPAQLACAPITNCGCDDGAVCSVTEVGDELGVACTAPGTVDVGGACEPGECKSGSHCWQGICRQACQRDVDCEVEGSACREFDAEDGVLSRISYCDAPCDVLLPAAPRGELHACPQGQTCVRTATSSVCTSAVGEGTQGVSCERDVDCAAGFGCVDSTCMPWCNPEETTCGEWSTCRDIPNADNADVHIGVCESACELPDVPGSTCGILPNCGCPAGQSCRVVDANGLTQCSVIGVGTEQAECESDFDCQFDLACLGGLCREYCDVAAPACPDAGSCFQLYYNEDPIEGIGLCGGSCDPVWPDTDDDVFTPCGSGGICQPGYLDGEPWKPYCVAVGDTDLVPVGDSCDPSADLCDHGSVCDGTCELLCRDESDCNGLTVVPQCLEASNGSLDFDGSTLGICCLGNPVENSECSTFGDACGCAEGEACRMASDEEGAYFVDGRTACSPAGEIGAQEACGVDSDCASGMSCVDSLCREHCDGECSATNGTCGQISIDGVDVPGARVCLGLCDPRAPEEATDEWDGCGAGSKCLPGTIGDPDYPLSQCTSSSADFEIGETCESYTDCRAGLACICVDAECTAGACQQWCVVGADDCADGLTCLEIGGQIKSGWPLGYCGE